MDLIRISFPISQAISTERFSFTDRQLPEHWSRNKQNRNQRNMNESARHKY